MILAFFGVMVTVLLTSPADKRLALPLSRRYLLQQYGEHGAHIGDAHQHLALGALLRRRLAAMLAVLHVLLLVAEACLAGLAQVHLVRLVDGAHVLAQVRHLAKRRLATAAHEAAERLLAGVHADVDLQHGRVREGRLADGARVRLVARVDALVHRQLRLLHESGLADGALVRLLPQMDAQMLAQVALEPAVTDLADERLLVAVEAVQVLVQRVLAHERLAAHLAHVVAPVLVPLQVVQQVGAVGERGAAQVADERPHLQVGALVLRQQARPPELLRAVAASASRERELA